MAQGAQLRIAETTCLLQSSHDAFIKTLARWTTKRNSREQDCDFTLRVQVKDAPEGLEPIHFRGSGHVVIAQYGSNVFLFDLLRRSVEARISQAVASNVRLWSRSFSASDSWCARAEYRGAATTQRLRGERRERDTDRRGIHGW